MSQYNVLVNLAVFQACLQYVRTFLWPIARTSSCGDRPICLESLAKDPSKSLLTLFELVGSV
jgi:hypothetical protein